MKDVTHLLNRYRECVRSLWNAYFMNQESVIPDWDMRDAYEDICVKLFSALVLNRVGRNNRDYPYGFPF